MGTILLVIIGAIAYSILYSGGGGSGGGGGAGGYFVILIPARYLRPISRR